MLALGLTDGQIGFLLSLNLAFQILGALLGGAITDKLGRRKTTFIFDIVSWSIPTLLWAIAQDFRYFVVAAVINLKSESNGNTPPKSGIGVNIEEARIDTLISKVTATGVIEPKNIETIYVDTYMDTSLRIKDILVELGDQVRKDTEIVKYDPITKEELEQQLKEAEISLENAKLRLQS